MANTVESSAMVRCIVCGGTVLATEAGALVGSITVTRDLFSRFEQ